MMKRVYPKYKDSGIKWLGEIPEGWEVKRLKYLSSVNDEILAETTDPDYEIRYVDISNVDAVLGIEHKEIMTFGNAPSRARRSVKHGDIIISTVRTYLRAITPIDNPESNLIVSTGFAVIRPKNEFESQFAFYALRAAYFVDTVVANSVGVSYPAINASELVTFYIALPPKSEQRTIAAFIDRETGRIDKLIEKKERKIELLHEKRSALISHAVTKGLDPNAKMKDSGIEWLGEIPEHWEAMRLKYAFILFRGFDLASDKFVDGPYPVCASNGIIGYHDQYTTEGPSITVGRSGSVGEVNFTESNFWAHNTALYVKKFLRAVPKFAYYLLKTLDLKSLSAGSAVGTLNRNYIHDLLIAIPSRPEQKVIAEFIDKETGQVEALIKKIQESIAKLREYCTALISAAVTGKIDVRGKDGKTVEMEEKVGRSGGRYDSC